MTNAANESKLFVYDDRYGLWYRENSIETEDLFTHNSKVFCRASSEVICLSNFEEIPSNEDQVPWMMDFGKIGFNTPFRKYVTRVVFRMRLKRNTRAAIYIQYDSDGTWIHVTDLRPSGAAEAMAVPITPHRCDHFNIKLAGQGEMEMISVTKYYEESTEYA
jgi:ribosomal protein L15